MCNRAMNDKLLIWTFKQGHPDALRWIYDKYHGELLKCAIVLVGRVDTAEDLVQDVFVQFAQAGKRMSLLGSLRNYLITCTINRIRNHRRDQQRRQTVSLTDPDQQRSCDRSPDQWAILSEQLEHLRAAMTCLPYEQREVITLRLEAGMTLKRIASLQQTSISTVQARYRYGLEKLRSSLNGELST